MGDFLISLIKTALAIIFLPLLVASAQTFWQHLPEYVTVSYNEFFMYGALSFLLIFLFIFRFWGPYELGQKISLAIFRFLTPLDKLLAYFFPFYLILFFVVFTVVHRFLSINAYDHYFLFFLGFIVAMQILQSAQEQQEGETQAFKLAYLLVLFSAIVVNIFFVVAGLDLVFAKLTIVKFFSSTITLAKDLYVIWIKKVLLLPQ